MDLFVYQPFKVNCFKDDTLVKLKFFTLFSFYSQNYSDLYFLLRQDWFKSINSQLCFLKQLSGRCSSICTNLLLQLMCVDYNLLVLYIYLLLDWLQILVQTTLSERFFYVPAFQHRSSFSELTLESIFSTTSLKSSSAVVQNFLLSAPSINVLSQMLSNSLFQYSKV
ncbi:hypothetical protein TTHERM_001262811 (macronuclear) [Tetrahymena thermophila SB210]|uniref:Uncharacterized protein n=1 Tax=Tetrahymena thermophila (strain SB210) TaxID=312017 RepID=W7WX87_TETTS|nr:hypothetical protein TTHERM_001262811 [Tetrahymena thermophila SB210]EWS71435.1 hypothetical protein TTHERM_001262811 [Tetrahymena thermophila SB210]|eukprot:XP_012656029.1 hypothetical protein TTHERM_001262811 [Tetrahymena thermophila SB210]